MSLPGATDGQAATVQPEAAHSPLRRVGMFGGAFDPPHRAHVALAEAAVAQLQLDVLYLMPTGMAWHKDRGLTPSDQRYAMCRLAFTGVPRSVVDGRELRRPGPTFTIDTLRQLQIEHPEARLFLVMGEDQAAGFSRWHEWPAIAGLAVLCVAARGEAGGGLQALQELPGVEVQPLALPSMPESASDIRTRLAAGEDVSPLVGPAVASYIAQHHLYAPP